MFIEGLFTILTPWKEPKSPTGEWIKKFWPIHIMKYCSAVRSEKKNKN